MTKEQATREALKQLVYEMEYVLSCINENEVPFDGDDFHEALRLGKKALANHIEDNLTMVAQPEKELTNLERHERNVQRLFGTPQPKEPIIKSYLEKDNSQPEQEPVANGKLKVTLQDTPTEIELAQYKRMFEAACSALGAIGETLGVDEEEGGAEPILAAIAELKAQTKEPEQDPTPTPNEGIEGSIRIFLKKSDGQWERLEKLEQVHEYNKQQWTQPEQRNVSEQQKPVAKLSWHPGFGFIMDMTDAGRKLPQGTHDLYTSPQPNKTWVEITPEELIEASNKQVMPKAFAAGAAWANAKLQEKNT